MQKIVVLTALLLMVNSVLGILIAIIRLVRRRPMPYLRLWIAAQMLLAGTLAVLVFSRGGLNIVSLFTVTAVLLTVIAVIFLARPGLTPSQRLWSAVQFLLAVILFLVGRAIPTSSTAAVAPPQMDRSSVRASFSSISMEGPHRQLVFHYALENATDRTFRIDPSACSTVSFRFLPKNQGGLPRSPRPNPALSLLEKDRGAYAKFTGLERLPTANPAISLDQCPLELQPKQRREVAIAIPYAYPAAAGENPSEKDLKAYVRAFMPDIDGFGIADLARKYQIDFPRPW